MPPPQPLETHASSLWVNRSACDELTKDGEPLSGPSAHPPSVVIFGIGDSGTRAVRSLYHAGGVAMCDETNGAAAVCDGVAEAVDYILKREASFA